AWLDEIVGQLMVVDPARRLGSAGEAAALLRDALNHVRNPTAQPLPKSLRTRPRHKGPLLVGLAVAASLGLGVYSALPESDDPSPQSQRQTDQKTDGVPVQAISQAEELDPMLDWNGDWLSWEIASVNQQLGVLDQALELDTKPVPFQSTTSTTDNQPYQGADQ
ncbi:MAG: hypothetical protein MI861_28545, partial [Pirellulales bacterium]|nr:hypothetical protein [Pirellulales bacterium]